MLGLALAGFALMGATPGWELLGAAAERNRDDHVTSRPGQPGVTHKTPQRA